MPFDAILLWIWSMPEGESVLWLEAPAFRWDVSLRSHTGTRIHDNLLAIQLDGMRGQWILGAWPRKLKFVFRGPSKRDQGYIKASVVSIQLLPVYVQSLLIRQVSYEALLERVAACGTPSREIV